MLVLIGTGVFEMYVVGPRTSNVSALIVIFGQSCDGEETSSDVATK